MKIRFLTVTVLSCLLLTGATFAAAPETTATVTASFTPDCEALLRNKLKAARKEIKVAIFNFSRKDLADALIERAQHNVKVSIKIDAREAEFEYTQELLKRMQQAKIAIEEIKLPGEAKMHHKFAVIDGKCVVTGSYNWTKRATVENAENLVAIESPAIAQQYLTEWQRIKSNPRP